MGKMMPEFRSTLQILQGSLHNLESRPSRKITQNNRLSFNLGHMNLSSMTWCYAMAKSYVPKLYQNIGKDVKLPVSLTPNCSLAWR